MSSANLFRRGIEKIPIAKSVVKGITKSINGFCRKTNVAMLHTGRCGSTVLGNMLNHHAKVYWGGETFEKHIGAVAPGRKHKGFAEQTIEESRQSSISAIYGFETKYLLEQHLSKDCINMNLEDYVALLRRMGFARFIVLHRNNYLRRTISAEVARQKKQWHSEDEATAAKTISLDPNSVVIGDNKSTVLELFRNLDESYAQLKNILSGNSVLHLIYENDILQDPRIAYEKTISFLEINSQSPKISLRRTNPFAYQEMVSNFEEIQEVLTGSQYEWMLDD